MNHSYDIEVFFDGDCPLCRREISVVRWLDRRGRIKLTDIAAADFAPQDVGKSFDQLMAEIHGRTPEGQWVVGVEVFRRIYGAVGLGWLAAPTRLPGISHVADFAYGVFAKNRLNWTGRCKSKGSSCAIESSTNKAHS